MKTISRILAKRNFWPLFGCMSLGALNDNFFRQALIVYAAFGAFGLSRESVTAYGAAASALLILPFFLFSGLAGQLCDSFRKSTIVKWAKAAEFAIMLVAAALLCHGHIMALLGLLFLMGAQSAFFGPVKYSLLPEILGEKELVMGNGLTEGATFVMIVLGTVLGSWLITLPGGRALAAAGLCAFSGAGLLFALRQPPSEKVRNFVPVRPSPAAATLEILAVARKRGDVWLSILALSWFWMMGSIILAQIPALTSKAMGADAGVNTFLVSVFAAGIGVGSLAAQLLTRGEVSAKLVPASSALLTVFLFCFAASARSLPAAEPGSVALGAFFGRWDYVRLALSALLTSVCAGLFAVPLNALVQHRAQKEERARTIAGLNVMNSAFMVAGAVLVMLLDRAGASLGTIFLLLALSAAFVTLATIYFLPDEALRQAAKAIIFLLYRPRVTGLENLEALGGAPALIIPNHTSFLDVALLVCWSPRRLTFAINEDWARAWWVRPFLRFFGAIPVKFSNPLSIRTMVGVLEEGRLLVVFPEGRITTTGSLMKVYDGPALIALRAGAPLVPVVIGGAEYSRFGRLRKVFRRAPRKFRVSMTVFPAERLRGERGADEGRRGYRKRLSGEVYELMQQSRFRAREWKSNLWHELLRQARAFGGKTRIIQDSMGGDWSYRELVRASKFLGRALSRVSAPGERLGVLLPNGNALTGLLFGLWAAGRVPVMLNYSQGPSSLSAAADAAEIKTVVTSRAFLDAARLRPLADSLGRRLFFLEDMDRSLWARAASLFFRGSPAPPESPACVVFTSGSEGKPKGVCLSHQNLLSNLHQARCLIEVNEDDLLFSAMPAFHAFGLNIGLLLPPLSGMRGFSHPSPLHVKTIPELIYDSGATVVVGSDTFARAWGENASPYDFHSVRLMILGAERLRAKTMELFFHKLSVRLFEGYGVTEASPVVAVGSRMRARGGSAGRILPGIEHRLEKVEGVERGGRLFLRGPNIMMGYIRPESPGAIEEPPDGWHDTGDIAEIDDDGFLWIRGRFRRFSKISGEMVSLAAVEDAIAKHFPGARFAVLGVPDPERGERLCLVSAGFAFDREGVREAVKGEGLSDLCVPKSFLELDDIPLTPLGKADIPKLQEKAEAALAAPGA